MTRLTIDQLLDLTLDLADELDAREVAGWTAMDLFESVVAVVTYLRQDPTEDFVWAMFDASQAAMSRRLALLRKPITAALAGLTSTPDEILKGSTSWSTAPSCPRATGLIRTTSSPASTTARV